MICMDDIVAWLNPGEIPAALRLLAVMQEFGQMPSAETAEWRRRIEAWGRYHAVGVEARPNA